MKRAQRVPELLIVRFQFRRGRKSDVDIRDVAFKIAMNLRSEAHHIGCYVPCVQQHGFNDALSRTIKRGVYNIASPFHATCIPVWVARNDRSCGVKRRWMCPPAKSATAARKLHVSGRLERRSIKGFFFVYFTIDLSRTMFTTRDGFGMLARLNPHTRVNPLKCNAMQHISCAVSALSETACLDQSAFIYLTTPSTHRKFVVSCEIKWMFHPSLCMINFHWATRNRIA
jgi:hypothetical protein